MSSPVTRYTKSGQEFRRRFATLLRMAASPGAAVTLLRMNFDVDVRPVLPLVGVPTLVLHRRGDRTINVEAGRYLAAHIPDARLVELEGDDHLPWVGDSDAQRAKGRSDGESGDRSPTRRGDRDGTGRV